MAEYYGFMFVIHPSVCCTSVICPSVFSFLDSNLSKYQWIFTKLGICTEIVEIWFGIANGQIFFLQLSAHHKIVARYYHFTFLFSANKTNANAQLSLAMAWNRCDIARHEIFTQDNRKYWKVGRLTLQCRALWITFSADNILNYFSQKTGFDFSCKFSPVETICMKCQCLFSDKSQ